MACRLAGAKSLSEPWRRHQKEHFPCYWPFVQQIHRTKASDAELWSASESTVEWTIVGLVIWDVTAPIVMKAGFLPIGTLRISFSEMLIEIYTFSSKKMLLKMSSAKWRPLCFGLNMLTVLNCQKAFCQKTFERHSLVRIFRLYLGLRFL